MEREETIKKLGKLMKGRDSISFAYIFGSFAEGRHGKLSDIDIAVFLAGNPGKEGIAKERLSLINAISSLLRTDRFDLVVMNEAPTLLNYNILRHGILLKEAVSRPVIEARIMCDYLDRKHYDDIYESMLLERVSRAGIL